MAANQKEYSMLFNLAAQVGSSFKSAFSSAQGSISDMQKEINALNKAQTDITAYQKQQSAVENSTKKLELLQQQYENIQRELSETEGFSASLENQLLSKQKQIDNTSTSLDQQTQKLDRMGTALNEAGIDTSALTEESVRLGNELNEVAQKQEKAAEGANAFAAAGQLIAAAGIAVALKEIAEWYSVCVDASMEFESAMAGVAKTTDLTDAELDAMARELQVLSTSIPTTANELAAIAEAAGQLGIAEEYIISFTEVMANLGVATNLSSEEAASQLAKFANITQMAATDYERLGSTIVALGNNTATTEADIVNMGMRLAAAGTQAGMTEAEIMSISAALSSLGLEAQAGGSSFSKVISQMQVSVETGSDSLHDFADVAGMSAEEFARAFKDDAASALSAFITGLSDTERLGASATVMLEEMGITELRMSDALKRASASGDLFNNTIALGNEAWASNTALQKEAAQRYATTESKLAMMNNAYANLTVAVGDAFTPALQEVYSVATKVLSSVAEFAARNPELVQGITAFIGVLGAAAVAVLAYTAVVKVATAVSAAFGLASASALLPVLAVVAGAAALIGVGVALASAFSSVDKEYKSLTSSSRQQYDQLQELNAEYERAKEQYGETSDEALALRYQVDELTVAYEANKQTLEEFIAETNALVESHEELISSYSQSIGAINNEEQGALALALKLQQLSEQTALTAVEQQQMQAIISELNSTVPDLALSYDSVTNSLNMSAQAVKDMVQAQAEQERQAESYRTWVDLAKEELTLKEQLAEAEENLRIRREELTAAGYNVDAPLIGWSTDLDDYQDEVNRLTAAYDENQTALATLTAQAEEYEAAQEEVAFGSEELNTLISDVTVQMEALASAYTEAYEAALSSVQGQYSLWDEAADVVATSAGSINSALESQITYWQDYNANISSLGERTSDIEGLSDVIASFADGSTDSVNAIAGMASATDEELAAMVANWQTLQAEQVTVSDSLALLVTDFEGAMATLQEELDAAVDEMDMSDIAVVSGRNTIQGFIDGAVDMLPAVTTAYGRIAQAAMDAIDSKLSIHSPSREMEWRAEMTWAGYINKTEAMTPELQAAMKEAAGAGVDAATAEQMQLVTLAPQLISAMSAMSVHSAVSAEHGVSYADGHSTISSPVFNITYNVQGENADSITDALHKHSDDLVEFIYDAIDEREQDNLRGGYR